MSILRPDEMEVGTEENGQRVTLAFRSDSGETQAVSLARAQIPTFVARLLQETEAGSAVPIDRGSLHIGNTFAVQSFHVLRRSDGARLLTLAVDMPDEGRVVTIPLELSPIEVTRLIEMLGSPLVQDN